MTQGKVRRGLSFWVFGWALLIAFPPLGLLWLVGWGAWVLLKMKEDRADRPKKPTYATPEQRLILHDGQWMTPQQVIAWESGGSVMGRHNNGATGLFQYMDNDWVAINQRAQFAARLKHAEETGEIR